MPAFLKIEELGKEGTDRQPVGEMDETVVMVAGEAERLADRIVVMHDGVVEQIGAPLELYDHPANLFVAQFIGTPPMNLLPQGAGVQARDIEQAVEQFLGRALPPIRQRWAGVYSQCIDPDQLVCRTSRDDDVWVITGPGGRGMTLGPAIAEQTADLIAL